MQNHWAEWVIENSTKGGSSMKIYKVLMLCCLSILLLSWGYISNAEADGESYCWQRPDGTILKLYATPVGNNYYSVFYYEKNEQEVYLRMGSGSAYVDTDHVIGSVHYTYNGSSNLTLPPTDADIYDCQFIFDIETLNGNVWCNGIVYDSGQLELKHDAGQLTYIECP